MIFDDKGGAPLMTLLHKPDSTLCLTQSTDQTTESWKEQLPSLYKYCLSLTHHIADAEDLMQETCLKILSAQRKGLSISQSEAYMIRTARNTWVDTIRRKRYMDDYIQQHQPIVQDVAEPCPQDIELAIQQLMNQLSPWQQAIFMLRDLFGYSAADTAQMLETTEGAVKAALYRARTMLTQTADSFDEYTPLAEDADMLVLLHQYVQALHTGDASKIVQLTVMRMNTTCQDVQAIAINTPLAHAKHSTSAVVSNTMQSFLPYHKQSYQSLSSEMRMAA